MIDVEFAGAVATNPAAARRRSRLHPCRDGGRAGPRQKGMQKMRKTRKLTAQQVYRAFKALSLDAEYRFIQLCLNDEENYVRSFADLAEKRLIIGTTAIERRDELIENVTAEAQPFRRRGTRRHVERDEMILQLRQQGLSQGEIGIRSEVLRLNDGEEMTADAVAKVIKRRDAN
jgi:hypothetical protein